MVHTILSVAQVFIAVGVIFLVLLHSGKDAGMSGAFVTLFGALIAIWPSPRGMARAVSAIYAARVGREVRVPV